MAFFQKKERKEKKKKKERKKEKCIFALLCKDIHPLKHHNQTCLGILKSRFLQGTVIHCGFFNFYPHRLTLSSWLQFYSARDPHGSQHSLPSLQALGHWDAGQPWARWLGIMPSLLTIGKESTVSQAGAWIQWGSWSVNNE